MYEDLEFCSNCFRFGTVYGFLQDILNAEKGYIKTDRVIVEAHITVQKTRGVR